MAAWTPAGWPCWACCRRLRPPCARWGRNGGLRTDLGGHHPRGVDAWTGFRLPAGQRLAVRIGTAHRGVGPWLPFQMIAAGWVGFGAGLLPQLRGRAEAPLIAAYGAVAAIAWFPAQPLVLALGHRDRDPAVVRGWGASAREPAPLAVVQPRHLPRIRPAARRPGRRTTADRRAADTRGTASSDRRAAFDVPIVFEPARSIGARRQGRTETGHEGGSAGHRRGGRHPQPFCHCETCRCALHRQRSTRRRSARRRCPPD